MTRAAFLAAAAILCGAASPADLPKPRRVVSVYDGDTIHVLGLGAVRLAGIDTPELAPRARCPRENGLAVVARDYIRQRLSGRVVLVRRPRDRDREKYGRLLRQAFAPDGGDVGAELEAKGLAVPYDGRGPRMDWCKP